MGRRRMWAPIRWTVALFTVFYVGRFVTTSTQQGLRSRVSFAIQEMKIPIASLAKEKCDVGQDTVLLTLEGIPWYFFRGDAITNAVKKRQIFESHIVHLIRSQLSVSTGILVDIGANVGVMTSVGLSQGRQVGPKKVKEQCTNAPKSYIPSPLMSSKFLNLLLS